MNADIQKWVVLTFALIAFAWVIFNATAINSLTQGTSSAYTNSVTTLINAGKNG